jgi:L-tyrosine isonitrile synthase
MTGEFAANAARLTSVGARDHSLLADRILRAFNTWAFKREQPSNLCLMRSAVMKAVTGGNAIPFILYWGKGPRHTLAEPDTQCLEFLESFGVRIRTEYPTGAAITLLLTDTHAALNNHPADEVDHYFSAIEDACSDLGFKHRRLGQVTPPDLNTNHVTARSAEKLVIPREILEALTQSATKWYGGDGAPKDGAARYFELNMEEKYAVEAQYPDSIFITFNGSKHRILFPDKLPIFYMYSLKKGIAVKPWFLDDPSMSLRMLAENGSTGVRQLTSVQHRSPSDRESI